MFFISRCYADHCSAAYKSEHHQDADVSEDLRNEIFSQIWVESWDEGNHRTNAFNVFFRLLLRWPQPWYRCRHGGREPFSLMRTSYQVGRPWCWREIYFLGNQDTHSVYRFVGLILLALADPVSLTVAKRTTRSLINTGWLAQRTGFRAWYKYFCMSRPVVEHRSAHNPQCRQRFSSFTMTAAFSYPPRHAGSWLLLLGCVETRSTAIGSSSPLSVKGYTGRWTNIERRHRISIQRLAVKPFVHTSGEAAFGASWKAVSRENPILLPAYCDRFEGFVYPQRYLKPQVLNCRLVVLDTFVNTHFWKHQVR